MLSRTLAVSAMLLLAAHPLGAADFEKDVEHALAPYYAALVASSDGNTDATQRQLLLFASRWEKVEREAASEAPASIRSDPQWSATLRAIDQKLKVARDLCSKRNVSAAHAQLESIRLSLRDLHSRHNVQTVDDHLTDLHEAMQRVVGHVAGQNEIVLKAKDFDDVDEDYQSAVQAWSAVRSSAGDLTRSSDWQNASAALGSTLDSIGRELKNRRAEPLVKSIEQFKEQYYKLILAVSKARG